MMQRWKQAFTLIEVLLATAIFFLLAGGIFAAISASNQVTGEIISAQLEAKRMDAFQRFLRTLFITLPADAAIELRIRDWGNRGPSVEVIIEPAPPVVTGGSDASGVAITGVPDGRGQFDISMATYFTPGDPAERDRELDEAEWTSLLPAIPRLRWRFAIPDDTALSETWTPSQGRPGLAELTLERADGSSQVLAFWIPNVTPPPPEEGQ